jgi:hypothetical protein
VANALANFHAEGITVNGNIDITAIADETNINGTDARANANLHFDASSGSINVNGHTRRRQCPDPGSGVASAW